MKKLLKFTANIIFWFIIVFAIAVIVINYYIRMSTSDKIITPQQAVNLEDVECVMVLGCDVDEDILTSVMLKDRIQLGIDLYEAGTAPKILMSAMQDQNSGDTVSVMKEYAINKGVSSEDIFIDHAGFSSYESVYRARNVYKVKKIVIVSQEYHLYRALYIAKELGLDEVYGVAADIHEYENKISNEVKEAFYGTRDFFYVMFQPKPTYIGDAIPVSVFSQWKKQNLL